MADYLRESGVKWLWERIKTLLSAKQDKLVSGTNIKTINGTSLLGSGDISIEGGDSTGDVDESRLVWTEKAVSKGTIIDNIMYNAHQNGLAFMNPSCIDVYYSTDNGDTWQDYGLTTTQKIYLVTPATGNYNLFLGKDSTNKSVNYRLRVDLRIKDADIQFTGNKLYLKWLNNTSSDAYYIDISVLKYENYETNEWTHVGTFHKKNTLTIPLNEVMGYNGAGGVLSLRIEVYRTGTTEPRYNSALTSIAFLYAAYTKGNSFAKTGLPMTIDTSQNAIFPAYIKARKFIPNGGKSTQVLMGDGSLRPISELSPITDADADILLDNHIHSINVNANGNNVNISVIESNKNGNNWETEDNDITIPLATTTSAGLMSKDMYSALKDGFIANIVEVTTNGNSVELSYDAAYPNSDGTFNMMEGEGVEIPLATTTSAGVMSKEDKAKLDGNISIEPDSGMPDFIGDFEYSDVDYEAIIDLTTVDWIDWVEGGLYLMNAEETWEEDNGDTSYHQCVVTFIYRSNGCIPLSIVNTNKMTAKMSGMVITINLTEGTGEIRFKQIKLI